MQQTENLLLLLGEIQQQTSDNNKILHRMCLHLRDFHVLLRDSYNVASEFVIMLKAFSPFAHLRICIHIDNAWN
jgi:hypothetical protein